MFFPSTKLTCLTVFLLSLSVMSIKAQNREVEWLQDINPSPPSGVLWKNVSQSVYPLSFGIPTGLLAIGYARGNGSKQRKGWHMLGNLVANALLTQSIKYVINRNRPYTDYPLLISPYDKSEAGRSFPSGHTSSAFALATSLSMEYRDWYIVLPAYLYASSVGYSRLYLGEHYPSDVLAGAAVGIGSAFLGRWLGKKVFPKKTVPLMANIELHEQLTIRK